MSLRNGDCPECLSSRWPLKYVKGAVRSPNARSQKEDCVILGKSPCHSSTVPPERKSVEAVAG